MVQHIFKKHRPSFGGSLICYIFVAWLWHFNAAHAGDEALICAPLDYTSYHRAQSGMSNIIRSNPDLTKPNFGEKYLVLKNELLFETLWLIADCKTGKFFREMLSGKAEFNSKGLTLVLRSNKKDADPNETPEYHLWNGAEWIRTEAPAVVTDAPVKTDTIKINQTNPSAVIPSTAAATTVLSGYAGLFVRHLIPAEDKSSELKCAAIDYSSYHRAQSGKENIQRLNPQVSQPNFAGKYLLLKNELLFENLWLIADCKTGKFFPEYVSGNAQFKPESMLVQLSGSGDFMKLMLWRDRQWVQLPDPTQSKKVKIKNSITGVEAEKLFAALPNPDRVKVLKFENLICKATVVETKATEPKKAAPTSEVNCQVNQSNIPAAQLGELVSLLKKWGSDSSGSDQILFGRCSIERKVAFCDIEIE
jgi:hypothetical protein